MRTEYGSYLGKPVNIKIDRPIGSSHPSYGFIIYPVNYGYIPGTVAGDGEAIDVYVLGAEQALDHVSAVIVGIARRKNDCEDKLIATLDGQIPPLRIIKAILDFQEQFFDTRYELINMNA